MVWSEARKYFDSALSLLGLVEWQDGFNWENIPDAILDRAYHITLGTITGTKRNQLAQECSQPVTVRLWFKGYGHPQEAVDEAIKVCESVFNEVTKPERRLNNDNIKNVEFESVSFTPYNISNDNVVLAEMEFSVKTIL